jgi:WD40 repeat protein
MMDRNRIVLFFLLLCALAAAAQALEPLWVYKTYTTEGNSVSLSSDGSTVAASLDRIYIFNGKGEKQWGGYMGAKVETTEDGAYIAAATDSGLAFLDRTGKILWMDTEWTPVTDVSVQGDGRYIGSVASGVISLYSNAGILLGRNTTYGATAIGVSPDGLMMVIGTSTSIKGLNQSGFEKWSGGSYENRRLVFSHDGSFVAGASANSVLVLHPAGYLLWSYRADNEIDDLALSGDDAYIAAGSMGKKVYLLDRMGGLIWNREIGDPVSSVAISGDGSFIAAGSTRGTDKGIYLFNNKGDLLGSYRAGGWIMDIALSSDGSSLAAVTSDGNLYYFRTAAAAAAFTPATEATPGTAAPGTTAAVPLPGTSMAAQTSPPLPAPSAATPATTPACTQPTKSGEVALESAILAGCSFLIVDLGYKRIR